MFTESSPRRQAPLTTRPLFTALPGRPTLFSEVRGETRWVGRARLEGLIAEAHHQAGNHAHSIAHARRALALLGEPIPEQRAEQVTSLMGQLLERRLQTWAPALYQHNEPDRVHLMTTAIQVRLMESLFYEEERLPLIWSACRALNLAEPAGPSPMLARCYILTGILLALSPQLRGFARWCVQRAQETAAEVGDPATTVFVSVRVAIYCIYEGRWGESEQLLKGALEMAHELRDARQILEAGCIRGLMAHYQGDFEKSEALYREVAERFKDPLDVQAKLWPPLEQGYNLLRRGAVDEAAAFYPKIKLVVDEETVVTDRLLVHGFEALLWLRQGRRARARAAADAINALVRDEPPVSYWIEQPLSIACEVPLQIWRDAPNTAPARLKQGAAQACATLDGFAHRFPFVSATAALWRGVLHDMEGDERKARRALERAVELGASYSSPYPQGRAHLELARQATGATRAAHLERACVLLRPLGCLHGESDVLDELVVY